MNLKYILIVVLAALAIAWWIEASAPALAGSKPGVVSNITIAGSKPGLSSGAGSGN